MIELILLAIGFTLIGLGVGFMVALWYIQRRMAKKMAMYLGEIDSEGFIQKIGGCKNDRDNDS